MKRTLRILTVVGFGIGSVACGGGGGSSSDSIDDFCNVLEDLEDISQLDPTDEDDFAEIEDFIAELRDLAPDDLQDDLDTLDEGFQTIADGDLEDLDVEELEDAADNIERFAERECDIEINTEDTEAPDETEAPADTPDETGAPDETSAPGETTGPADTIAPPSGDGDAAIVTEAGIGFFPSYDETQATWGALITNPNTGLVAEYVEVQVTFRDAAGAVVGTTETYLSEILPGETRAVGDDFLDEVPDTAATLDVVTNTSSFRPADELESIAMTFSNITLTPVDGGGVRVVAEMSSSSSRVVESPSVTAIFRDPAGAIIGASYSYANFVPVGGVVGVEVQSSLSFPAGTTAELYSDHSSYFYEDEEQPNAADVEVLESGFSSFEAYGSPQGSWAAIISNPNTDVAVNYVSVIATFRDAAGAVVDVDQGTVSAIPPSGTAAYATDYVYDLPPGATSVEVVAHTSTFRTEIPVGQLTVSGIVLSTDEYDDLQVVGEITSTFATNAESVEAIAVFRDAAGVIIGGAVEYLDFIPANSSIGFTIGTSIERTDPLTAEVFLDYGDVFDE